MKKLPFIVLLGVLAGFIVGLVHLFNLRFEAGDNYPEYSSLRADPLGSKAFYESLGRLLPARRSFQRLTKLGDGRDTTLFYLGAHAEDLRFTEDQFKDLETFVRTGGRLVISVFPSYQTTRPSRFGPGTPPGTVPPRTGTNRPPAIPPRANPPVPQGDQLAEFHRVSIKDRWNLSFTHAPLARDRDGTYLPATARRKDDSDLPATLAIHSALCFDKLDPEWRVTYARPTTTNDLPVLIERIVGKGAIVLSADSYLFSNEAMRYERLPSLLAWFVGPSRSAVFDETHLGVNEVSGIATLMRKYRLHGLFAALLVLAALFVWKNFLSFMPPPEEELAREQSEQIEGKDSAVGFVNLLRRNIPPAELMQVCLEQWNAHFVHARRPSRAKLEAMQKIIDAENALEPRERNPVQTYRRFCDVLKSTKRGAPVERVK